MKKYKVDGDCAHNGCFDGLFFNRIMPLKSRLGGRVEFMVTGSAPVKAEVIDFIKMSLGINVVEGYGMTENAGSHCNTRIDDTCAGHVG